MQSPRFLASLVLLAALSPLYAQAPTPAGCRAAADYSLAQQGLALLVLHRGEIVFEDYRRGWSPATPQHVFSGTKSFQPIVALLLQEMGLLTLEEKVADTIHEWRDDPLKSRITVRMLLDFTSGLGRSPGEGRMGQSSDYYGSALQARVRTPPGERWAYGSTSLHVFGELVQRKLRAHAREHPDTPTEITALLREKVLGPIGCDVPQWIRDPKGQAALAFGAFMTARSWARFGQLILQQGRWGERQLLPADGLSACFAGSAAKQNYGLNWWLVGELWHRRYPVIPRDTAAAVGLFGQKLYVIPSRELVIVRFGRTGGPVDISDRDLLERLLTPRRARI